MADYQDWVDNQEEEEAQMPPETFAPEVHLRAKRKSIVIHDLSKKKGKEEPAREGGGGGGGAPAGEEGGDASGSTTLPQASTSRLNVSSGGGGGGGANRASRIFPDLEIANPPGKDEPKGEKIYRTEAKWPWALLALLFLAGSVVMAVFGGMCLRREFEDPDNAASVCGPGGTGGGIVMLIGGGLIFPTAIWQLWRLKESKRVFVGYKETP